MLLRFGLSNFLSIAEYQQLSFAASNLQDDSSHLIQIENPSIGTAAYLPVIALYGANAAGKSNFLIGLHSGADAVRYSYKVATLPNQEKKRNRMGYRPCRSSLECKGKDSHFDVDFLLNGVRYHYGFEVGEKGYSREWLYAYPKKARQIIFIRDFDDEENPFEAGPALRTKLDPTLRSLARDSSFLFLSAAGTLKNAVLEPIYTYFDERIVFLHDIAKANELQVAEQLQDERLKKFVVQFLDAVDSGIVDIEISESERSDKEKQAIAGMFDAVGKALKQIDPDAPDLPYSGKEIDYTVRFVHEGIDKHRFKLGIGMESSGTLHLLSILSSVLSALENGRILIIDEITTSLHTMVSKELVKLFTDPKVNQSAAQFIFSTHDTNLLSNDILRRDEIWFAEKDNGGDTHMYPLTDFKTRKGDNIEKGYLQGRFGGIPYFGDIAALLGNIARS